MDAVQMTCSQLSCRLQSDSGAWQVAAALAAAAHAAPPTRRRLNPARLHGHRTSLQRTMPPRRPPPACGVEALPDALVGAVLGFAGVAEGCVDPGCEKAVRKSDVAAWSVVCLSAARCSSPPTPFGLQRDSAHDSSHHFKILAQPVCHAGVQAVEAPLLC